MFDGDLQLQPGKVGAQAIVRTVTEPDMRVGVAADDEPFAVFEHPLVTVRRLSGDHEHIPLPDLLAGERRGLDRHPRQHGPGVEGDEPEQFLHGRGHEAGVSPQLLPLGGVGEQHEREVGQLVADGVEPGHQDADGQLNQLRLGQLKAAVPHGDQRAHQVAARLGATGSDQRRGVVHHVRFKPLPPGGRDAGASGDRIGPCLQLVQIGRGDAAQLADYL